MILPDVNVLIYAFRKEVPEHSVCRRWLDSVVLGDARFGLAPLALSALVRVTTNRRAYSMPSSLDDAFGFCQDLLGQPHCQLVEPGERHWDPGPFVAAKPGFSDPKYRRAFREPALPVDS